MIIAKVEMWKTVVFESETLELWSEPEDFFTVVGEMCHIFGVDVIGGGWVAEPSGVYFFVESEHDSKILQDTVQLAIEAQQALKIWRDGRENKTKD